MLLLIYIRPLVKTASQSHTQVWRGMRRKCSE